MDCLWGNNIHVIISNQNYDDCNKWCLDNTNCGGYIALNTTRYPNRCYIKDKSCKNKLFASHLRTAYIPQGN